jgi:phage terminase large subunit-like protein
VKAWSTACPDWERRITTGRPLIAFPPIFPEQAREALDVFKALKIVDAPGSPTFGEASEQWLFDLVAAIFGAYDAETGRQQIREIMLLISKKNGKSTNAAAIILTAAIRNWRHSAELGIIAPTIEVAQNSFKPAADMIRADEELSDLFLVQDHIRTITHRVTKSTLKIVAADTETLAGVKWAVVLVEELWLFGKRGNAQAMLREALGGMASHPEGFVLYISTQSDEPPAGVFKEKLDYFRAVRDGEIVNPRALPVLYEFPQAMVDSKAYLEPRNFYVTNPNIGRSVDEEWLETQMGQIGEGDAGGLAVFLSKHLNVEIGQNLRANRWPGADYWAEQADPQLVELEALLERSEAVVVGIDGGGLDDLFGLVLLGRERGSRDYLCWSHAFCHRGVLKRRQKIAAQLLDFEKAGELTIVDDELDDISGITGRIAEVQERELLAGVAVDPAALGELIEALGEMGITQEAGLLVGVPQGWQMMNSIKTAERKLVNGTLKHSGSKLMAWCVGNLKIEPTATAIRATKQSAGDAKIDVAMALFDAVTLMMRNPEPRREPTYQLMFAG